MASWIDRTFDWVAGFYGYVPRQELITSEEAFEDLDLVAQEAFRRLKETHALEHWTTEMGICGVDMSVDDLGDVHYTVSFDFEQLQDRFRRMGFNLEKIPDVEIDITDKVLAEEQDVAYATGESANFSGDESTINYFFSGDESTINYFARVAEELAKGKE